MAAQKYLIWWLNVVPSKLVAALSADTPTRDALNIESIKVQLRNRFGAGRAQAECTEVKEEADNRLDLLVQSNFTFERKWTQTDTVLAYVKNGSSPLADILTLNDEGFDDEWVNVMCPGKF